MLPNRVSWFVYQIAVLALAVVFEVLSLAGVASAQEPTPLRRVGVLCVTLLPGEMQGFRQGLRDAGYTEGRDVVIEWQLAQGDSSRVSALIADLLRAKPQVIVADATPAIQAAKRATATIPIVMVAPGDPLGSGLVDSLALPGGNVTGLSIMARELNVKRLELLKEAIPTIKRVGVLWDPSVSWHRKAVSDLEAAARALGLILTPVRVQRVSDFEVAFSALRDAHVEAISVLDSAFFQQERRTLLRLAAGAKLPVMCAEKASVSEGGLISYSADTIDMFRRSAWYVDQILRGAKPGDLPVEQPTKFELVVSVKAAKTLGLIVPESILLRADEVIR